MTPKDKEMIDTSYFESKYKTCRSAFLIRMREHRKMEKEAMKDKQRIGELRKQVEALQMRVGEYEATLKSIAGNTCCDKCQEAALWAKKALTAGEGEVD